MKQKTNLWTKILVFFLGCLGFSCSIEGGSEELYGCPYADYKVNGTVTDEDGEPVKGASVELRGYSLAYNDTVYTHYINDAESGTDGSFEIQADWVIDEVYLKTKADGYETDSTNFEFGELTGGDGDWYEGAASATVNITLKKAEDSDDSVKDTTSTNN